MEFLLAAFAAMVVVLIAASGSSNGGASVATKTESKPTGARRMNSVLFLGDSLSAGTGPTATGAPDVAAVGVDLEGTLKRVWPAGWRTPTMTMIKYIEEAATKFGIPLAFFYSLIKRESNFNAKLRGYAHGGNSKSYAAKYAKLHDQVIPGRNPNSIRWGDMFPTPSDYRPIGLCQVNPDNLIGKTGGVPAGGNMFDIVPNIRCAAALLVAFKEKYGSWDGALIGYNGGNKKYRQDVADGILEFSEANGIDPSSV